MFWLHCMVSKKNHYIIADHIRASCFLISAGVRPSGKQRGYILRRLIRRALSSSLKLNISLENIHYYEDLVDSVISIYKGVYDEIEQNRDSIVQTLFTEAQKYQKAIIVGEKEWAKLLSHQQSK